jgi:hypothetical protein
MHVGGKPEPPEETYVVRESRPLYHMRCGFDRESNPRPQRWQALMVISNIDRTTVPLWQPIPTSNIPTYRRDFYPHFKMLANVPRDTFCLVSWFRKKASLGMRFSSLKWVLWREIRITMWETINEST